jgi:hypothetical protein
VGGEEPVVPVKVAGTVLTLTVFRLMQVFHDRGPGRFRILVVGIEVGDESNA